MQAPRIAAGTAANRSLHQRAAGEHADRPPPQHRRPARGVRRARPRRVPAYRPARRCAGVPAAGAAPPAPRASRRGCRCSSRPAAARLPPGTAIRRRAPRPTTGAKASSARASGSESAPAACTGGGNRGQRVHRHVPARRVEPEARSGRPRSRQRRRCHRRPSRASTSRTSAPRRGAERHDARATGRTAQPRQQRRVGRQHRNAVRLQRTQDLGLFVGDRLDRAEIADMRLLHRGDDRDMRPREAGQRRDLARMVHADLGDAERGVRRQTRQRQRQAPMVVVRRDRGVRAAERRQDGAQHLLRRGLADAAGDRDQPSGEALPRIAAQPVQRRPACRRRSSRWSASGDVAMHHRAGRTLGQRVGDEGVTVAGLAAAGRRTGRRLRWCACRSRRRWQRTASPSCHRWPPADRAGSTMGGPSVHVHAAASRRTTSTSSNGITVSPIVCPCSWPLPATASTSPGRQPVQRLGDRTLPVADLAPTRTRRQHRGADRGRILAARIVVGDDRHVGEARRGRAHQRPLAAIAIAAGTEHHVQPPLRVRTQRGQQPLQRVRRMRVVDVDRGAVRQPRRQFQPAAHAAQRRQPIQRIALAQRARPGPRPSAHCRPGTGRAAAAAISCRTPGQPRRAAPDRPGAARPPAAGSRCPPRPRCAASSRRRAAISASAASVAGIHLAACATTGAPAGSRSSNSRSLAAR